MKKDNLHVENLHNLATMDKEKARAIQSLGGKARAEQRRRTKNLINLFYSSQKIDKFIDEIERGYYDTSVEFTHQEKRQIFNLIVLICKDLNIIKDNPIDEELAIKILNKYELDIKVDKGIKNLEKVLNKQKKKKSL